MLSKLAAKDDFALLREYSHRILYSSLSFDALAKKRNSVVPVEFGLANYFSGSFLNRPKLGEIIAADHYRPYLFNLENSQKITKLTFDFSTDPYELQDVGRTFLGLTE